jgi:hypothetical protein
MDALTPKSLRESDGNLAAESELVRKPDRHAYRNLVLLTCCQAVGQACNTMMFAATG